MSSQLKDIVELVEIEIKGMSYTELYESWKSMRYNELLDNEQLFLDAWHNVFGEEEISPEED